MHLHQLPSGHWRVIVQQGGIRRSLTAPTRLEAQHRGARALIDMGGASVVEAITVAELLDDHIDAQPLAPSTRTQYRYVRRQLLPAAFEQRPVPSVNPVVIDALYRGFDERSLSAHQIRKLHSLLSGAFRRAVRLGLLTINPCREAQLPREPAPDTYTPSSAETRDLLTACDGISPEFGLFCRIAAHTGARRGEVLGLQRGDVDIDAGTLTYRRAIATEHGRLYVTEPKGGRHARRRVAITSSLVARIAAHELAQDIVAHEIGGSLEADAWLFTADYRSPWYPTTVTHWWARAREAAGVTGVRLHDLRHFVATELFAGGFDEQTTMRRLGHTNPVTTGKRYATARPARDAAAAIYLEGRLE